MSDEQVLIAGDCETTLEEVEQWVSAETSAFDRALTRDHALRLQRGKPYQLAMLCFESLQVTQAVLDALIANLDADSQQQRPVIVVLCGKDEIETAFSLCDDGIIDDYVLFRPLYDPYRLRLVIRNGLRQQRTKAHADTLRGDMRTVARDVGKLSNFAGDLQQESKSAARRSRQRLGKLGADISSRIDEARTTLKERLDAAGVSGFDDVDAAMQQLGKQVVQQQLSQASDELEDWLVDWVDDCSEQHRDLVGSIADKCADSLRSSTTILLVEDEAFSMRFTRQLLAKHHFKLVFAETGRGAVGKALGERPDLILLDLKLPDFNGDQVIRKLRADTRTRDIPVIALTGITSKDVVTNLIRLGIAGYQVKPPDETRLLEQMKTVLAG